MKASNECPVCHWKGGNFVTRDGVVFCPLCDRVTEAQLELFEAMDEESKIDKGEDEGDNDAT